MAHLGEQPRSRQVSPAWGLALLALCVLPGALMWLGVDFSTHKPSATLADSVLPQHQLAFELLRGSFTHTILEWTAVCAALVVCGLAFVRYRLSRDAFMPIVGIALACAGAMDAFHTLAADRLISALADNRQLIPFTWALCRMFNSVLVLSGVGLYIWFGRQARPSRELVKTTALICACLVLASYCVIVACANSQSLPQTMFPEALITVRGQISGRDETQHTLSIDLTATDADGQVLAQGWMDFQFSDVSP